jgi:hypothetical protein
MDFAVYLFGSEKRKTSFPESDVDLIFVSVEPLSAHQMQDTIEKLLHQFPHWRGRFIDCQYIPARQIRPTKPSEVTVLASLNQSAQLVAGVDLLGACYKPTWDDYFLAVKLRALNWIHTLQATDVQQLFDICCQPKRLKTLCRIVFSMTLYLEMQKHLGKWILSPEQIKHPLLKETTELIRGKHHGVMPTDKAEAQKIRALCVKISEMARDLKTNLPD